MQNRGNFEGIAKEEKLKWLHSAEFEVILKIIFSNQIVFMNGNRKH